MGFNAVVEEGKPRAAICCHAEGHEEVVRSESWALTAQVL